MEGRSITVGVALAVALPEPSLDRLRRGPFGRAILAVGLLSLGAGYVLPFAADLRLPQQHTRAVALESLHVPTLAFPVLRVPKAVPANAHVALPVAPLPTRATTTPHRPAQRAVVAPQRARRVPVVENTYVIVAQPKPATKEDNSAPVYEESIGAMPDVMIDPATLDPVVQAAAQAADQERIARLEAEAQARAEAAAAAEAQARAQVEASAAAPPAAPAAPVVTTSVTVTVAPQSDTAPAPTATAPATETIAASSSTTVTSPAPAEIAPAEIAPAAPVPTEAVAAPAPLPDPVPAPVAPTVTDPVPLPPVTEPSAALPIDTTMTVTPPAEPSATPATSENDATTVSAPSGDTPTATTGGGSTSATDSSATTTSEPPTAAPAAELTATAPDATITLGESVPPAAARGPPAGATAISAADGGVVASADAGASVSFAPGVLLNDVYVTVTPSSAPAPTGVAPASPAYDLVAYNANGDIVEHFGGAAELTINYASATPPRIYYLSPTDGAIALDTRVDPAAHTVQAWLVHFSTYVAATPLDEFANGPPVTDVTVAVTVLAPGGTAIADALVQGTSDTGYEVRGRTDAAGAISLGVSRGLWTFSVNGVSNLQSAAQAVDTATGSPSYALGLALDEFPVYVTGTVRDADGNPLAGVRVEARSESGAARADDFALSGPDGSYRLGGLLGQWSINGQDLTNYYPHALESHYTPAASHGASLAVTGTTKQDLTYTLMPRRLTGNLRDQYGNGVAGASVHLEVYSQTFDFHFSATVISAGDGSYIARLPSDVFRVDIRAELQPAGYGALDVESVTWNAPSPDAGTAVVLPDFHYYKFSTSASGVVRNEAGITVGGYTVAAVFWSAFRARWFWIEATTDASGAWAIAGDPGEWNIYPLTSIVGYSAAPVRGLVVSAVGVTGVELVLVAGTAVSGTVTFQDTGAAAAGVGIKACGFSCAVTTTNSLGEYLVWLAVDPQTRSSDGTVHMLTGKTGYARSSAAVVGALAGGRLVRDLLYIAFSTPYSGTVLDSFGTPVPGAVVRLTDGLDEALVTPLADGTWSGFGPAGEARVSATGVYPTSGSSQVLIASAGATDIVVLLPATGLAGTVTDDLGTALAGVTIGAERWLCNFGAAHCDWADLFGSFYGERISTVASTVTDAAGNYEFTLDPALFSDNFPLRLAPQRVDGHLTPGRVTPRYLAGQVTDADFVYPRATIEIQGVANGGVYGHAVTPVIVTTPVFDAVEVTLNGISWTPGEISADGTYTIVARALRSGAEAARATMSFAIDTIAPVVTIGGVADGGSYAAAVTPEIVATDANLAFRTMTLDGSPFAGGAVSAEGRHVLVVTATDWAANAASATVVFLVDLTSPTTALTTNPASGPFNDHAVFTLDAADEGSGVQSTYTSLDGGPANLYSAPFSLSGLAGAHTLSWYSIDNVGNTEAALSATLVFSHPTVSVGDVSISEGDSGPTLATFTFTLSETAFADVTITYSLADGTATTEVDFVGGTGTATIAAGATSTSVNVTVDGDTTLEPDETFTLTITHVDGADLGVGVATGTILNDDVPQADLVLTKTVAPTTVLIGVEIVYRFDVRNAGPQTAQNVEFLDRVDAPVEFVGIDVATSFGSCLWLAASRTVSCASTSLAAGATASAGFRFRTTTPGTFTNTATVTSTTSDPSPANNTDSATLDVVPAAPTRPDLLAADDSGLSSADNNTNVTRPRFSVNAPASVLVELVEAGTVLGSAIANDLGVAIVQVEIRLADGLHAIAARARVNALATPSALSTALNVRIDTVAPSAPVLDLTAAEDSGRSNADDVTNSGQWHIYASPGDGNIVVTTEVAPNGRVTTFETTPGRLFVFFPDAGGGLGPDGRQGTWSYTAHGEDLAGNRSADSNVLAIAFDSIAPAAPVLDLRDADDSGSSSTDGVTNDDTWRIFGAVDDADSLSTQEVAPDGRVTTSAVAPDHVCSPDQQGEWTYQARGVDLAGNVSVLSNMLAVTYDSVAPDAPTRPDLRTADDSGVFGDDDVTNASRPHFDTTYVSGALLTLFVDGVAYAGTADVADGAHSITATATDLAGNVSAASEALTVTIDTTTPAGTVVLADGAAGAHDPDVPAVVSFSDVVAPYQLRFSLDGGATWSDWQAYTTELRLTLPGADGVKTVLLEVRDLAGNVGSTSDDIRLDRAGPTITIASPAAGAVFDVAQIVALVFTALDPSGIDSTSVMLDGRPLGSSAIDTLLLSVGTHTLVVTAADTLGNVSTSTLTFEVLATIAGLQAAVRRAAAAGLIDRREVQNLLQELDNAARELAKGDRKDAARELRDFAERIMDEAGRRIDRAFAVRAAGWALDLADRIAPRFTYNSRRGRR
jgi:uncharacterized repeat protein (TIGR01451 family)